MKIWKCYDTTRKGKGALRKLKALFLLQECGAIMNEEIMEILNGQIFGVWFLIGAALVF